MADVVASMADVVDALRHEETLLALFCTNMFLITIALFMQTIRQPTSLATEEVAAAALSAEPSATIGEADGGALAMTGAADSGARRNQSSDRPTSKHRFTGLEPSEPGQWWHSPCASDAEAAIIKDAMQLVDADLHPLPPHADMTLLRQLRGPALGCDAAALAAMYSTALRWRRSNVLKLPNGRETLWPAAVDFAHGEWASQYVQMGFSIGRARGGHPVKLERLGYADVPRLMKSPNGPARIEAFYYSLLESLLTALDAESAASGRLLRMYEVFDMTGLGMWQISFSALGFVRKVLHVVLRVYSEVTCKGAWASRSQPTPTRGLAACRPRLAPHREQHAAQAAHHSVRLD